MRDVIIQQIVQTLIGTLLGMTEPDDTFGKEEYDVAVWVRRIRIAQRALPGLLSLVGVNAVGLAKNLASSHPMLAGAILGGQYPFLTTSIDASTGYASNAPSFAGWELKFASIIYWYLFPAVQYGIAILWVDTWQYFLHRLMHMNKWLYTTFHSRHHRLYMPYAYGALYNHPFEGFLLDTVGASIGYKIAGMNTRQGMWFFTGSTIKTVDDHCGYALPWDPLQHLTSNNSGYHDVHHQSWGIKASIPDLNRTITSNSLQTNFSQPFFTFWDRWLGTVWTGGDVSARYERSRLAAQKPVDEDNVRSTITHSNPADSITQNPKPYQDELRNATDLLAMPTESQQPSAPRGKAELQAAGSRQQVLDDKKYGGPSVLAEEAQEEKEACSMLRRSPRKKSVSSISKNDSFRGLRERVTGSMHGRTGGILGMESSR